MSDKIRFEKLTRYYTLSVQQDLFGWVVVKSFGRTGTALGNIQTLPFEDELAARLYFSQECKRRLSRGYHLVKAC